MFRFLFCIIVNKIFKLKIALEHIGHQFTAMFKLLYNPKSTKYDFIHAS